MNKYQLFYSVLGFRIFILKTTQSITIYLKRDKTPVHNTNFPSFAQSFLFFTVGHCCRRNFPHWSAS